MDNIEMDVNVTEWENLDWIHLAQRPVAICFKHGNETSGSIKDSKFLDYVSDSAFQEGLLT
jgi:hypothetical protein